MDSGSSGSESSAPNWAAATLTQVRGGGCWWQLRELLRGRSPASRTPWHVVPPYLSPGSHELAPSPAVTPALDSASPPVLPAPGPLAREPPRRSRVIHLAGHWTRPASWSCGYAVRMTACWGTAAPPAPSRHYR